MVVKKASEYTHAKRGYFVFWGEYPRMKHKYFLSRERAYEFNRKVDKKKKKKK